MATRPEKKRRGSEKCSRPAACFYYKTAVSFLALAFGFLHHWHVSTLFENYRHFSHLSEIEREMSFRTEMGMYYSYYKTIVESKSFVEGLQKISNDNLTEFPNSINAIKKYNLFPEVFIGLLYHTGKSFGVLSKPQCWQIERGNGLSAVRSCVGIGEPIYFYLEAVWYCAAATGAILFIYATYLSESVYGGVITVIAFFYNHNDCTRVQWTPPLRESFAYPLLLCQMYSVTVAIREHQRQGQRLQILSWEEVFKNRTYRNILISTMISLLCWQFSQFVFATQIFAFLLLKWTKIIPEDLHVRLIRVHLISVSSVILITKNSLLLYSLYTGLLIGTASWIVLKPTWNRINNTILEIAITLISATIIKALRIGPEDDAHVFNILLSKLTDYKDFHTMLYTCSLEFDFLQYETYEAIVKTMVLPTAVLSRVLVTYFWYRSVRTEGFPKGIESDTAYVTLQSIAFIIMAVFIMRLKLFMTPNICILASLVASKRYLEKLGIKSEIVRASAVVLVIASMSFHGLQRVQEEREIVGEYSNVEQEELFDWIQKSTPRSAVFAGKMSLMANVMLSTRRAIVNNPYYEDAEMRERTMKVYELFSRKDAATVYNTLRAMKVDYVILEEGLCYGLGNERPGCQMIDLWDMVDNNRDKEMGKQALCPKLFQGNAHPFRRVFLNRHYAVLRLDYSKYVELKPRVTKFYQS